ncbi:MAG TPA: hypothetical protein VG754_13425 [Verrucomicrobiae bacterium]|jgi:ElaB/YqjD/DUF883 family membrane-anchored ribosome-binding protein|nr:hypothetical protein [Verrucomicrobiae bacterium]
METETRKGNGHGMTLEKLMQDLKVVVDDGQELLKGGAGQLRIKAVAGAKATDETIRRNPYPSMAIIFGLGVALGILGFSLLQGGAEEFGEEQD